MVDKEFGRIYDLFWWFNFVFIITVCILVSYEFRFGLIVKVFYFFKGFDKF